MELSLQGRHALVGGASRGIGAATAKALANLGADVTGLARSEEGLARVMDGLDTSAGQTHGYIAVDFSDPEGLGASIKELVSKRPVQILINNTGGPPDGPAASAPLHEFQAAFTMHLACNHILMQTTVPGMRTAGYGRIINVISTSVKQPIPGLGVSNTIRGAVANWAKTLAFELGPDGITVNNVLPGFTDTDRLDEIIGSRQSRTGEEDEAIIAAMKSTVPVRRFASADETAGTIAFLASPAAGYINGVNLPVDGGRTGSL